MYYVLNSFEKYFHRILITCCTVMKIFKFANLKAIIHEAIDLLLWQLNYLSLRLFLQKVFLIWCEFEWIRKIQESQNLYVFTFPESVSWNNSYFVNHQYISLFTISWFRRLALLQEVLHFRAILLGLQFRATLFWRSVSKRQPKKCSTLKC